MTNESSIVVVATTAVGLSIMAATMDMTQVVLAAFIFAGTVSNLLFAYLTARMNRSVISTKDEVVAAKKELITAAENAAETAKVAVTTAQMTITKTDKLLEVSDGIHKLANSNLQESEKRRAAAEERAIVLQTLVDKLLSQTVESRAVEPKNG